MNYPLFSITPQRGCPISDGINSVGYDSSSHFVKSYPDDVITRSRENTIPFRE